ncbi:MAG: hypothetical protein QGG09_10835 [Pirellulaceae bacterium]|jgi:hypothetical protein|nr:hypothetical protein [Pirellulaceae bacterium]
MDLSKLLGGDDDRALVDALVEQVRKERRCTLDRFVTVPNPCNEVERTVFFVWDSCAMICSSGLLYLFENNADLAECSKCYLAVGLESVASLFDRVARMLPEHLRDRDFRDIGRQFADWTDEDEVYNAFRAVDLEYFEQTTGEVVPDALGVYIRRHSDRLSHYLHP